ncbi:MAG TPA: lipoprotein-releasing ABC transporter permease subunit, partial [Steroidobacteraceae bacterium]|nr:lipoprotein-releasing ABC transporter permease subunit [Steroidobacteraceae bacterium]
TPLPLGIGLRYVRARQHQYFVSFISWVSLAGVCLGVAALITILSVMNGFEGELRGRLLALAAHATVPASADPRALEDLAARARGVTGVARAEAYVEIQGLLSQGPMFAGAAVRGIVPQDHGAGTALGAAMQQGSLAALTPGSRRIVLGRALAQQLGAAPGDEVTLLLLATGVEGELTPRLGAFEVAGLFEMGLADHDATLALVALEDATAFAGAAAPAGLLLWFADPFDAPRLAPAVAAALGTGRASDWTTEHAAYFRAIRIEKTMMTVILLLIVSVAAFNIVASLVMVVAGKRNDIAILRTLGFSRGGVVGTFVVQGTVIGWAGALAGTLLGILLATHVDAVAGALEAVFGFEIFDSDVYYITRIPSQLRAADVLLVAGAAFALTLLATIYPARRAAATEPAEALRYE